VIRDATPDDLDLVANFNGKLALETEGKQLDPAVLLPGVRAALACPDRLRYWVAQAADQPIGQAAITPEWSDWRNGWIWWIQSVYVHPEHRGQGIFRALFDHIESTARSTGDVVGLRLYVEVQNARAQRVYEAMGLAGGEYHVMERIWGGNITRTAD
jgi:GNAT superfamily N-acetyltransferase